MLTNGVFKYMDCSTGHISAETDRFLKTESGTNDLGMTIADYENGYFVSVPEQGCESKEIPDDLKNLLDYARSKRCSILRLDADGMTYDNLATFEW